MRCDKWAGPKVSWKFNDPLEYDTRCTLKRSMSAFSTYLFQDKSATACAFCMC